MGFFVTVRSIAPKNKKDAALQKAFEKYHNTTTELAFQDLKKHFQKIVDTANAENKRSSEAIMKSYAPGHVEGYPNGSFEISGGNIFIVCTHIKGYIRSDFAVQTQI